MFFGKIRSRLRNRVTKKAVLEELREIKKEIVSTRRAFASLGEVFLIRPTEKKEGDTSTEALLKKEWFGEDD